MYEKQRDLSEHREKQMYTTKLLKLIFFPKDLSCIAVGRGDSKRKLWYVGRIIGISFVHSCTLELFFKITHILNDALWTDTMQWHYF